MFRGRLRRVGSSLGLIVPRTALEGSNLREGDEVDVAVVPLAADRRLALHKFIGSMPGLGPFRREKKDRF